jgi:group II intron reverse transcriptase/maturase
MIKEILSKANLSAAYKQVVSNKGCAGVDKMTVKDLKDYLRKQWKTIETEIENGTYQPQKVLGVEIPKPNGGGVRLLGIPTVLDRMVQQAINQYLSPLYEPEFSVFSYAFRPGRNAHQAILQAQAYINEGYQYVIDLDLKSFFDLVNHDYLMSLLHRKIKDPILLKLIRKYLKAGIMLNGVVQERESGTPQGSPLSPLLSNIILNELDKELTKRGLRFVRYADDVSIYVKSERAAKRVLASITRFIEGKLKLKVNQEKTSICRPLKLQLLGFAFTSTYNKGDKGKYQLVTSDKSFKRLKEKIKHITRKTRPMTFEERATDLQLLTQGWVAYYKLSNMWQKLKELDGWVRSRLRYCIWKQWKKPDRRKRAYIQLGIDPEMAYQWSRSRKGGWAVAQSPMMKTTVTKERLKQRGYVSFLEVFERMHYTK